MTIPFSLILQLAVVAGSAWGQAMPDELAWTASTGGEFGAARSFGLISVAYAAVVTLLFTVSSSRSK
jgi:hypothetical protein